MSATHILENPWLSLTVSENGASISRFVFRPLNFAVLRSSSNSEDVSMAGMFPLLPFVNRIAGNAFTWRGKQISLPITQRDEPYFLHGDGWHQRWHMQPQDSNVLQLKLTTHGELPGIYSYDASIIFRLEGSKLHIRLQLTNTGDGPFPFGLGLHPFFQAMPATLVHFMAEKIWLEDECHISVEPPIEIPEILSFNKSRTIPSQWLNYCYLLPERINATIDHPNGLTIKLLSDVYYLQIYKPSGPSEFFCLEPQTQFGNAHHAPNFSSLTILKPAQSMLLDTSIDCKFRD